MAVLPVEAAVAGAAGLHLHIPPDLLRVQDLPHSGPTTSGGETDQVT